MRIGWRSVCRDSEKTPKISTFALKTARREPACGLLETVPWLMKAYGRSAVFWRWNLSSMWLQIRAKSSRGNILTPITHCLKSDLPQNHHCPVSLPVMANQSQMKTILQRTACLLCAALVILAQPPKLTKADVDGMMKELSNWGRWGKDDQVGAYHLITPAVRKAAAALVKDGVSISLSRRLDTEKALDNANPFASKPIRDGDFAMDEYTVSYHGFAHTHMDSLGHMSVAGKGFNGFPSPAPNKGLDKLAIGNFKDGIFTRGVLIDLPKLKGVKYLEPGTAIYPADLDAWEKSTGIHIGSGDAV